jgi:hypothetical protein
LNSLGDRLVDPACSQAIGQHWETELIQHPTAGHDLPLDDGEWTTEKIAEWRHRLQIRP